MASETLSIVALEFLLAILGAHQQPGTRLLSLASATVTALVFGSLSIVFVAAAWTDPVMLVIIIGVAIGLTFGYRRHRILSLKHQQSSELQQFVKGLGAIDLDSADGPSVLNHVRVLLRAGVLELAVQADGAWRRLTVDAQGSTVEDAPSAEAVLGGRPVLSAACLESSDRMVTPLMGTVDLLGVITVRDRLGAQRAFGLHDLRLLETLGAELAGALERGRLQRDLTLAATTDPLTRLPNLNEVTSRLERLLENGAGVLVATLAVESFREVNDTLGHQVGDELLMEVTRRLHLTYPDALLGRIGGGRFAVVMQQQAFGGDLSMFGLGIRAQI
jgi:predicted signal transduction protein with EAL and GGDEF domain